MSFLVSPLAFPLGYGTAISAPWVVNFRPRRDELSGSFTDPISLSIRDGETNLNRTSLDIVFSLADYFLRGNELPTNTIIGSVYSDTLVDIPTTAIISETIQITKTSSSYQGSTYFIPVTKRATNSLLLSLVITPQTISTGSSNRGAVFGIQNGLLNTGVYLFLIDDSGKKVKLMGPDGTSFTVSYDWNATVRYTVFWNSIDSTVEVYAEKNNTTAKLFSKPLNTFSTTYSSFIKRSSTDTDIFFFGQEGLSGDSSRFSNILASNNTSLPLHSGNAVGDYKTTIVPTAIIEIKTGEDPQHDVENPWFPLPEELFTVGIADGTVSTTTKKLVMTKPSSYDSSIGFYREEPGFLKSGISGFLVGLRGEVNSSILNGEFTGFSTRVYDGLNVFNFNIIKKNNAYILGLQKNTGGPELLTNHIALLVLDTIIDLSILVDSRTGKINIYDGFSSNLIKTIEFSSSSIPNSGNYSYSTTVSPYIAFGFLDSSVSSGSFTLESLYYSYNSFYWDATSGEVPTASDPIFTLRNEGGPAPTIDTSLDITTSPKGINSVNKWATYALELEEVITGVVIDATVKISDYKLNNETPVFFGLRLNNKLYCINFTDSLLGKFVTPSITKEDSLESFCKEKGVMVNWSEYHLYSIRFDIKNGLDLYIDNEFKAHYSIDEDFITNNCFTNAVFFGHPSFGDYPYGTSNWTYFRISSESGIDLSIRKISNLNPVGKYLSLLVKATD